MTDVRQDTSDEKRRRLLKGALGASTVMTLGYGGSAAAASINCVQRLAQNPNTIYPPGFVLDPNNYPNWEWESVVVYEYQRTGSPGNNGFYYGYHFDGNVYSAEFPSANLGTVFALRSELSGRGWNTTGSLLIYFDFQGNKLGTYPEFSGSVSRVGPATTSCGSSINPGGGMNMLGG